MNTVASRLADIPAVRDVVLAAATTARAKVRGEVTELGNAMAHAWIITGPPGSGRSVAAVAFAAALQCSDPVELGCGRCRNCLDVLADAHTDVLHIVPKGLSISIDEMREMRKEAAKLPTVAGWRIIIIEDADRLTGPAADAILKVVEEPPAHTVIMMCAPSIDPDDFSPTLRSRCRHLYVPYPSVEHIVDLLVAETGATPEDARLAAVASGRHIGRARHLVTDPAAQKRRATILNLAELIFHRDEAFKASTAFLKSVDKQVKDLSDEQDAAELEKLERSLGKGGRGKGTQKAMDGSAGAISDLEKTQKTRRNRRKRDFLDLALVDLACLYRDALMLSVGADVQLTHPDFEGLSSDLAERVSESGLVACLDAVTQAREHISVNVTPTTAIDGMIGRIRLACGVS
ncbi:DNA polymerase III subunit delta' [Corynebacterium comes]|uniref:DNA polymerase III subunit delta n=1 Tax=Corynebacterium comes TaxID=2675218 RepID=A0A6B8VU97_9CORY|nr:DNA polymerase III subunit delta' [Corynebacterium comes]QGU03611.1 DNA polymerase III subunit delta' [Corynebacterium comes]